MAAWDALASQTFYGNPWWTAYVLLAIVFLLIARGAYRASRGVRIRSPDRLLTRPMVLLALYALSVFGTLAAAIGTNYQTLGIVAVVAEIAAIVVGFAVADRTIPASLTLHPDPSTGTWIYRISPVIAIAYLAMFAVRSAIEAVVIGALPFTVPSTLTGLSAAAIYSLVVVDLLWGFTTGLSTGRGWVIRREYLRRTSTATTTGTALP